MFGSKWRRRAEGLRVEYDDLKAIHGVVIDELVELKRDLRSLRLAVASADVGLDGERVENARLRIAIRSKQAGLDHATGAYEQAEADLKAMIDRCEQLEVGRMTLASQRDQAYRERDKWREIAEAASDISADVMTCCRDFVTNLSKLRNAPDVRDADPDRAEAAEDRLEAGCRFRVVRGPCDCGTTPDHRPPA